MSPGVASKPAAPAGSGSRGARPGDPLAGLEPRPLPARRHGPKLGRVALYLLLPLAVLFGVRALVAEPFHIPSESMLPTLEPGDRVVANKLAYRFGEPRIGDLVVLQSPSGEIMAKRIVATGGQRVEIRDGVLQVDRRPRRERYVDYEMVDGFFFGPARVPAGSFFVLGDNRGISEDSRDFGAIPRDRLIGRVDLRIPPLDELLG